MALILCTCSPPLSLPPLLYTSLLSYPKGKSTFALTPSALPQITRDQEGCGLVVVPKKTLQDHFSMPKSAQTLAYMAFCDPSKVNQNSQHFQLKRSAFWDHLLESLVAPYTTRLSQRYPPIARYGVFGVSTWTIGRDTPSPFSERFPCGEHAKWKCDTPPQKGYLSDTGAIPYENKAKRVRYPPLRYYLERVLRGRGVSRTGPLSLSLCIIFQGLMRIDCFMGPPNLGVYRVGAKNVCVAEVETFFSVP